MCSSKFNNIKYFYDYPFAKTVNRIFTKIASKLDVLSYQLVDEEINLNEVVKEMEDESEK